MKNRNIPYYVAALMLAAGVSTSFVSCVDTDEPDSIVTLRNAKAEEVKAQAEVQKALAAYQNAQTELKLAEKAEKAAKAKSAEVEASLKELELAKQKELDVLEIQEAKARTAKNVAGAEADTEKAKIEAENALAIAKVDAEKKLATAKKDAAVAVAGYENAINEAIINAKVAAAKFKVYGAKDSELEKKMLAYEDALANVQKAIKAVKEAIELSIEKGDEAALEQNVTEAQEQLKEAQDAKQKFEDDVKNSVYQLATWQAEYDKQAKIVEETTPKLNKATFEYEEMLNNFTEAKKKADAAETKAEKDYESKVDALNESVQEETEDAGFELVIANEKLRALIKDDDLKEWGFKYDDEDEQKIIVDETIDFQAFENAAYESMNSTKGVLFNEILIKGNEVTPLEALQEALAEIPNKFDKNWYQAEYVQNLIDNAFTQKECIDGYDKDKNPNPTSPIYQHKLNDKGEVIIAKDDDDKPVHLTFETFENQIKKFIDVAKVITDKLDEGKGKDIKSDELKELKQYNEILFGSEKPANEKPLLTLPYDAEKSWALEEDLEGATKVIKTNLLNSADYMNSAYAAYIKRVKSTLVSEDDYKKYDEAEKLAADLQKLIDAYATDLENAEADDKKGIEDAKTAAVKEALKGFDFLGEKKDAEGLAEYLVKVEEKRGEKDKLSDAKNRAETIQKLITGGTLTSKYTFPKKEDGELVYDEDGNIEYEDEDKVFDGGTFSYGDEKIEEYTLGEDKDAEPSNKKEQLKVGAQYQETYDGIIRYLDSKIEEAEKTVKDRQAVLDAYKEAVAAAEKEDYTGDFKSIKQDNIVGENAANIKQRLNDIIKVQKEDATLNLKTAQEALEDASAELEKEKKYYE